MPFNEAVTLAQRPEFGCMCLKPVTICIDPIVSPPDRDAIAGRNLQCLGQLETLLRIR